MYQLKHSRDHPAVPSRVEEKVIELRPTFGHSHPLAVCFPREIRYRYICFCFLPLARNQLTTVYTPVGHTSSLSSRELRLPANRSSSNSLKRTKIVERRFWGLQCGHRCASNSSGRDSFTENILSDQRVDDFRLFLRNFFTNFTTGTNFVPSLHFCT